VLIDARLPDPPARASATTASPGNVPRRPTRHRSHPPHFGWCA